MLLVGDNRLWYQVMSAILRSLAVAPTLLSGLLPASKYSATTAVNMLVQLGDNALVTVRNILINGLYTEQWHVHSMIIYCRFPILPLCTVFQLNSTSTF